VATRRNAREGFDWGAPDSLIRCAAVGIVLSQLTISDLATGAAIWMCLVALLSFHEFGHAWAAHKCGDDTARLMGRMTINPVVHIDPIGTVLIPWVLILTPMLGVDLPFLVFGWAKPVPVNPSNYDSRKRGDILVSMAGPAVNLGLAVLLMVVLSIAGAWPEKLAVQQLWENPAVMVVFLSLILCFFNLIPVPPLDGSHVLRHIIGMSEETYMQIAQYGFIIILLLINFTSVFRFVAQISFDTMVFVATNLGMSK